jgi:hypothetical protein
VASAATAVEQDAGAFLDLFLQLVMHLLHEFVVGKLRQTISSSDMSNVLSSHGT